LINKNGKNSFIWNGGSAAEDKATGSGERLAKLKNDKKKLQEEMHKLNA
jgi:hypothetical protein